MRRFTQVDVFTDEPYRGNPVAVVHDAEGLSDEEMQRFSNWTNLSETTFLLPPTTPEADYRVRIFTPAQELPFAGHPTLGTCHTWLTNGGKSAKDDIVVQECAAGLIRLRRDGMRLAFAAPPLVRSGPVDESTIGEAAAALGLDRSAIIDAQWADNGPGWLAVRLADAEAVLSVTMPTSTELNLGLVGAYPEGGPADIEVRAFFSGAGAMFEDPVTGSLNASLAQWLLGSGQLTAPYVSSQGTALGRAGLAHISQDENGTIWVGGDTTTCIVGEVDL
ncbi:MAG: PhzF family phenazine biosynthesis protein [Streptosporangiaceae bacterium]|jgi:PhzF family phenazine biosynthesis protein